MLTISIILVFIGCVLAWLFWGTQLDFTCGQVLLLSLFLDCYKMIIIKRKI